MKQNLWSGVACAGLLIFSLSAIQAAPQYHDDNAWHQTRDQYFSGDSWRSKLFDRVRLDLDHVQEIAFGQNDEDRIVMTKEKVSDLRTKWPQVSTINRNWMTLSPVWKKWWPITDWPRAIAICWRTT